MPTTEPTPPFHPPTPSNITLPAVQEIIHQYHHTFINYFFKFKFNNDHSKYKNAVEAVRWRHTLPSSIKKRSAVGLSDGSILGLGLELDEVLKLVQFKMHHGQNRPFLPGMVRKNSASSVQNATARAHRILLDSKTEPQISPEKSPAIAKPAVKPINKALDACCELTGIGPATASLILSSFDPLNIPYFEDELYHWFFNSNADTYNQKGEIDGEVGTPSPTGKPPSSPLEQINPNLKFTPIEKQKSRPKLKYNVKEYNALLEAVLDLRARLGADKVSAVEIEQVAFMLVNWEFVSSRDKDRIVRVQLGLIEPEGQISRGETKGVGGGADVIESIETQTQAGTISGGKVVETQERSGNSGKRKKRQSSTTIAIATTVADADADADVDADTNQEIINNKDKKEGGTDNSTSITIKPGNDKQQKKRKTHPPIQKEEDQNNNIKIKSKQVEESEPSNLRRSKRKKT